MSKTEEKFTDMAIFRRASFFDYARVSRLVLGDFPTTDVQFVTTNAKKFAETGHRFGFVQASIELDEIQSESTTLVAMDKVMRAFGILKRAVLIDDAGLSVQRPDGTWTPAALVKFDRSFHYFFGPAVEEVSYGLVDADGTGIVVTARTRGVIVDHEPYAGTDWDAVFEVGGVSSSTRKEFEIDSRSLALRHLRHFWSNPCAYSPLFWSLGKPAPHWLDMTLGEFMTLARQSGLPSFDALFHAHNKTVLITPGSAYSVGNTSLRQFHSWRIVQAPISTTD